MKPKIDDTKCSFCESPNKCMAYSEEPCWCNDATIPKELIDLVPEQKKRNACICLDCINAYNENPTKFEKHINESTSNR